MSTIEQAAKRLEQLRRSGVDVEAAPDGDDLLRASERKLESVPLRIAKALETRADEREAPPAVPAVLESAEATATPAARGGGSRVHVDIDLERLSADGYITPQALRSRLSEEFRVIKRPLLINARGKSAAPVLNANRIMVTSALPGEGKTFVSLNLAMSLVAEVDTQVLLVDADASRPALGQRLRLAPSKGLLDLLADPNLSLDDVVLSTNVDGLSIIPAGKPHSHATELLASEGMTRLVNRLASDDPRRIVLFDTPPLLAASESRVLASHMGQVIFVISADDTPRGAVSEALATIETCPVVFTLLNRVSPSDRSNYYGSYGAYAS